jgi:D-alanyl-D-alanine dipeptidase
MKRYRFAMAGLSCFILLALIGGAISCRKNPGLEAPKDFPPAKLDISKKPIDANLNWKPILGKYQKIEGKPEDYFLIREEALKLLLNYGKKEYVLEQVTYKEYSCKDDNPLQLRKLIFVIDKKGFSALCKANNNYYEHITYADKTFNLITFMHPIVKIKKDLPTLVDVKEVDPTLLIDLKFTPKQTAFLQKETTDALKKANQSLKVYGYELILLDAYRPKEVSILKEADADYQTGKTVSVMLFNTKAQQMVSMGSSYLEFSERSVLSYLGGTSLERWYRTFLNNAMESAGFKGSITNWWQFTYKVVN